MPKKKLNVLWTSKAYPVAFASLDKPNQYGNQDITLRIPEDDFPEVEKELRSMFADAAERGSWDKTAKKMVPVKLTKNHKVPWIKFEDDEKEGFEGVVRLKAKYKPTEEAPMPTLYDAKNRTLPSKVKVRSGDVVRVIAIVTAYPGMGSGISLRLKAVKLIEKNNNGGIDAAAEFGDDEGFEYEPDDEENTVEKENEDGDAENLNADF